MVTNKQPSTKGEYLIARAALLRGKKIENVGILLLDSGSNRLHSRFRRDCEEFAADDADWFLCLDDEVSARSRELGGEKCLEWMESTLSHALWISQRHSIVVNSYFMMTRQLYLKYTQPKVLPFRTHLPVFSLEAAAGKFGKQMQVEPEGWAEVWPQFSLSEDHVCNAPYGSFDGTGHSGRQSLRDSCQLD